MGVISRLSDRELLTRVERAAHDERQATAHLIALLIEVESRGLHLAQGFPSLFTFCTQALHLSEHAAYNRIETARAARRYPIILALVKAGDITLTNVRLLAPHLTIDNYIDLLARVRHKSKRDVELLVATIHPQPDVAPMITKLADPVHVEPPAIDCPSAGENGDAPPACSDEPAPNTTVASDRGHAVIQPLSPARYKIEFTIDGETHDRLRRVQNLLRHAHPDGDVSEIFRRALALLESQLERTKLAATENPREAHPADASSRHVPSALKRVVWRRDGGRCAYTGDSGRCTATAFLEYHHVVPFAAGGAMSAANIELRCRAHNQYEAKIFFGRAGPPSAAAGDGNSFRNEFRSADG